MARVPPFLLPVRESLRPCRQGVHRAKRGRRGVVWVVVAGTAFGEGDGELLFSGVMFLNVVGK